MTKEEERILRTFETRIRQLLLQHKAIIQENNDLYRELENKEEAIQALQTENSRLRSEYANLKLAKMIEINDDDMKDAKSRLSKLVRDVDKCIALLNV
jgi:predicted nuclease with TOPRIM domain